MKIEKYKEEHFPQIEALLRDHNSIARRELDSEFSFTNLSKKLADDRAVTFCCLENNKIISFFVSSKIATLSTWYVRLVCTEKTNFFNPAKMGICELYNSTINYWESTGIENFIYIQPSIFLSSGNLKTRNGSYKLQEYCPTDYCLIRAGTQSNEEFIRNLMSNIIFKEDMVVRWCFKNEE